MEVETKLHLMKHTDSYWTLLPVIVKELILQYRDSQALIEHRESVVSRELCEQIRLYAELSRTWFVGPIRCQCIRMRDGVIEMRVYGHYWTLMNENKNCFLGYDLEGAIAYCATGKDRVWFDISPVTMYLLLKSEGVIP